MKHQLIMEIIESNSFFLWLSQKKSTLQAARTSSAVLGEGRGCSFEGSCKLIHRTMTIGRLHNDLLKVIEPITSMVMVYLTDIYHRNQPNVGKYTILHGL